MRRRSGGCRGWCWCPGRPGWASRGWAGSSRSTSTAWRRRCGGTGAGACPTGRGWRSGRWPRSCASGWASPRKTRPRPPRASWPPGWTGIVPDPGERAYVGVRLGRLLGVAFAGDGGGQLGREELFAGWRLFFERLAAVGPVVLLVEDAQHADAGLLDFLDHLIDWVRDLPIFVLVLARPELGQARPGFGAGRNRITLTLDPLDAASMDALVEALVPGDAGPGPGEGHRPGAGHPAVRGGNHPVADRPGHRPAHRGGLPAGRRHRGAGGAGQPARAAGRPPGRPGPGGAAAGRRRGGAGHHLPGRGADRRVRAGRSRRCGRRWPSWCAGRCSPCPPTRCRRSRAATASPSTCCARSPTTPCPGATARPATWRWPRTCAPPSPATARKSPR